jgi:hypothetical protein
MYQHVTGEEKIPFSGGESYGVSGPIYRPRHPSAVMTSEATYVISIFQIMLLT